MGFGAAQPGWSASQAPEGPQIVFNAVTLRPDGFVDLKPVPLVAQAPPGATLSIRWTATSTSSHGVISGRTAITVATSTLPISTVLAEAGD